MPRNTTPLFTYSHADAQWNEGLDQWWESFTANRDCAREVQSALAEQAPVPEELLDELLGQWGYRRMEYVMANTIRVMHDNGLTVPREDLLWARGIYIPEDPEYNSRFAVNGYQERIYAFMAQLREARQKLGLFGEEHCVQSSQPQNYTGKVLVMDPKTLSERYWAPEHQLWYAWSGFGCDPGARGRAVFATALFDGKEARWDRQDFLGVIRDECLPQWAKEKLDELQTWMRGQEQDATAMTMQ